MTLKGVPAELCAAFDLNPADYTLLGVMADAADENGEPEVAECLRFLWKHRLLPDQSGCKFWWNDMPVKMLNVMVEASDWSCSTPCNTLYRLLWAWPQHKQLLIDALESVCTT